ncbi:extracellular solute-binding protein [Rhodovarius lipocyclicus]|uniref:extracellular solute-binding protein n=1 Tax=Rhodovarius lipocyclicus TaxID=268410 RepID=UPI0013584667|nr:extracellular solute-binding protein [Rhodovarius lipocyclicus]
MTEKTVSKSAGLNRRGLAAATLAAPLFYVQNGWAQGKSLYVGTYSGVQGEYFRRNVIPRFQTDFNCRVFQREGVTLGQIAILRTEKARPSYSVMMMDDLGIPIAKNENLIDELPAAKIPNLEKVFPAFRYSENYGVAFAISTVTPFTNTAVPPLESFADLWNPRFRGRFMMINPRLTQSVHLLAIATSLVTGKPVLEAQYEMDKGWDKMAELKANVQTLYDNTGATVLQVSQGQADVAGPEWSKGLVPYIMRGAPVVQSRPSEGSFAGVNCVTLVKGAPEPDLGAAFIDRILSPAVQKGLAEATYAAPSVTGIDLAAQVASVVPYPESRMRDLRLYVLDWNHINPLRGAILERFNQVFGS